MNGGLTLPDWGWVDWALLGLLALSVMVGAVRGFVYECLALAGWVVAWFAAQALVPWLAPQLPVGQPGSALNGGAAFALAFVGVLVAWSLAARLVRLLLHATPLSVVDRLLGALFGLLRGAVALVVVAALVGYTPAAQSAAWRASRGAVLLQRALGAVGPWLPGRGEPATVPLPAPGPSPGPPPQRAPAPTGTSA